MTEDSDQSSKWVPIGVLLMVAACVLVGLTLLHLRMPYPFVMADEFYYGQLARFAHQPGSIVGKFPNHLYLRVFRQVYACGDGFLACGRFINVLFLTASLLPLYRTARLFVSRTMAIVLATLAIIGPAHTYTTYFMPETMYFFLFWCVCWFVLACLGRGPWTLGVGTGVLCGLLTLIKPHGLFVAGALALFYASLALFRRGRYSLSWFAKTMAATGMLFLVVRLGLGYLLAGREGFDLAGQYQSYASSISNPANILPLWSELARILSGHIGAIVLLFPIPLALGLFQLRSLPKPAPEPSTRADVTELSLFMLVVLGILVILIAKFTVEIEQVAAAELDRLHGRYYDFVFPLLLIMVGAFLQKGERLPRSATRIVLALLLSGCAVWLLFLLQTLRLGFVDHPYLVWIARYPRTLVFLVLLGMLLQAVCLFNPRRAAWVFLFCFFPVVAALADVSITMKILLAHQGDVYDKAGRVARQLLPSSQLGQGIVVGQDVSGLFRSLFQLDSQTTKIRVLSAGVVIEPGTLEADRTWALIMGDHKLKIPYATRVALEGASLVAFKPGLLPVSNPSSAP
jgi:phosphoglycerol transferase